MKLGFIANSSLALPTLQNLLKDKKIVAIGIPDRLNPDSEHIICWRHKMERRHFVLNEIS